jgi:hypothetical protein
MPVSSIAGPNQASDRDMGAEFAAAPHAGFVLLQVFEGMAIVQGRTGLDEVSLGDRLADGSKVEKIERHGLRWVVFTDRGYIAESAPLGGFSRIKDER